jgi:hypothetical protein
MWFVLSNMFALCRSKLQLFPPFPCIILAWIMILLMFMIAEMFIGLFFMILSDARKYMKSKHYMNSIMIIIFASQGLRSALRIFTLGIVIRIFEVTYGDGLYVMQLVVAATNQNALYKKHMFCRKNVNKIKMRVHIKWCCKFEIKALVYHWITVWASSTTIAFIFFLELAWF